jgi:hypothetical protein
MSAFICAEKTFSDIYSGMRLYGNSPIWSDAGIAHTFKLISEGRKPEELIDILYRLNTRAVNQRYGEEKPEELTAKELNNLCAFNPHVSKAQFLKSLECLSYQMAEGDVPETKFYKQVDKLICAVALSIVHTSKEYEAAKWDN